MRLRHRFAERTKRQTKALFIVLIFATLAVPMRADSLIDYIGEGNKIIKNSKDDINAVEAALAKITDPAKRAALLNLLSQEVASEQKGIAAKEELFELQQEALENGIDLGELRVDNYHPVGRTLDGTPALLTFGFVKAVTGQPAIDAPAIGSVQYFAQEDPSNPGVFTPIGSSSDAGNQFAISWIVSGFEPLIEAVPYSPSGAPVVINGVAGDNIAVGHVFDIPATVPEPSSLSLLLAGLGLIAICYRRRCL
jgi:hypothetical protein